VVLKAVVQTRHFSSNHPQLVILAGAGLQETLTRRAEILKGIEQGEKDFAEGRTASWEEVKADLAKWRT
jgi:predicted transcriptional regulator